MKEAPSPWEDIPMFVFNKRQSGVCNEGLDVAIEVATTCNKFLLVAHDAKCAEQQVRDQWLRGLRRTPLKLCREKIRDLFHATYDMCMLWQFWGATPEEINGPLAGDHVVPNATLVATRSITLAAPPEIVFAWLQQMGFGKGGWYSYDLIDNLGRTSAMRIYPEWQNLQPGDEVPGGPISFYADTVEPHTALLLRLGQNPATHQRIAFSLAYELRQLPEGTRLVTRIRAHVDLPGGQFIERMLLGPGDGIMMRKQLLNLAKRTG